MASWKNMVGIAATAIAFTLILLSCNVNRRLARIKANHPQTAAEFFSNAYPIRDSSHVEVKTVRDTFLMPGEMITVNCDSTHDTLNHLVFVQCPPTRLIREMVTKDSIVFRENTATVTSTRLQLKAKTDEATKWRDKASNRLKWLLIGWGAIGVLAVAAGVKLWAKWKTKAVAAVIPKA